MTTMRPAPISLPAVALTPIALALFALATAAPAAAADTWQVDPGRSLFAVLTHKAGIGARLAHDHLIVARGAKVALELDAAAPAGAKLSFQVPVLALEVDPAAERGRWSARLQELGVLAAPLPAVDEDDRAKVREAMLAPGQLAAERFPEIRAELVSIVRRGGAEGARVALGWDLKVRVTIRGKSVEKTVPARWELEDGELSAEALGELRFSEFGIEPYSAMLGAIRNDDLFHILVELVARSGTAAPGTAAPATP